MSNYLRKGLCFMLALVLALTVLPAITPKAEAAKGDVSNEGIVLVEENFDYADKAAFLASNLYKSVPTISSTNGILDFDSENKDLVINRKANKGNVWVDLTFGGFDIPASQTQTGIMALKIEAKVKVSEYRAEVGFIASNGINADCAVVEESYTGQTSTNNVKIDASTDYQVVTSYIYSTNVLEDVQIRLQARIAADNTKVAASVLTVDQIKVSLVFFNGSSSISDATVQELLAHGNGYVKLTDNLTLSDTYKNIVMGSHAVLDLNGKTLTFAEGGTLLAGSASNIVDTSTAKTGKIVIQKNTGEKTYLDLGLNPANAAFPVWSEADGAYLFIDRPNLVVGTHAFITEKSADSFTVQFRPGFGEHNGKNVRETYLDEGKSGITMDIALNWKDIYGVEEAAADALSADEMFNQMYANAKNAAQITLKGVKEYQQIGINVSVMSCGVVHTFDAITFTNEQINVHYAQKSETGEPFVMANNTKFDFSDNVITTGAGATLVMDFDYYFVDANNSKDYFSISLRDAKQYTSQNYAALFCARGYNKANDYTMLTSGWDDENLSDANGVRVHCEINLETGAYTYTFGEKTRSGTLENLPTMLEAKKAIYVHFTTNATHECNAAEDAYRFDNVLIYTYINPSEA